LVVPCRTQTCEHVLKNCLRWKAQQKILWAEVREETGTGKNRFTIWDRCSQVVLDFFAITDIG
jgi:hypothetical protein